MTTGHDQTKRKPYCVVIDTNIWCSDLLLKTPMGRSLIYALQRQGGQIGLPEVIERELEYQVVEYGLGLAKKLADLCWKVSTLTDSVFPEPELTKAELELKVKERLVELESTLKLVRVPFTLEHAKAALDMVMAKSPPNAENDQQFKDSAIWQAVLKLAEDHDVCLVSSDHGFFLNRKEPSKGLALKLKEDCQRVGASVTPHCDLASCLNRITAEPPSFDKAPLVSLVTTALMPRIRDDVARKGFRITGQPEAQTQVFSMGESNRVAVDFVLTVPLTADRAGARIDCRAIARGGCYYNPEANSISGDFLSSVFIEWKHPSGGEGRMATAFESEDPFFSVAPPPSWWDWIERTACL